MEDSDQQPTTSPVPPANNGGVMDIQPPKQPSADMEPTEPPADSVVTEPAMPPEAPVEEAAPVDPPETEPETAAETTPIPAPVVVTNSGEKPAEATETPETPVAPGADNPMAITNAKQPVAKKKSGAPMIVIIVAVIIALGLSALVITIYFKSKHDAKKTATTSQKTVASKVTPDEIDQATKDTDATLNQVDDAKDFADSQLTDATLGL